MSDTRTESSKDVVEPEVQETAVPAEPCACAVTTETPFSAKSEEEILDTILVRPRGSAVRNEGEDWVLIDRNTFRWIRTNRVGKEIITSCNGVNKVSDIVRDVEIQYDIDHDLAKVSCLTVLKGGVDLGFLKVHKAPKHATIWIHVTERCNMRCPFCFQGDPRETDKHSPMSKQDWAETAKSFSNIPKLSITISGGEPTLCPDLEEIITVFREMPNVDQICLITNGTAVSPEKYRDLSDLVTMIQISIDGTSKEVNDRIRGEGNFEKVAATIQYLTDHGVRNMWLSFTPTKLNISEMPSMVPFSLRAGAAGLHVNTLMPAGRAYDRYADLVVSPKDLEAATVNLFREYSLCMGWFYKVRQSDLRNISRPPLVLDVAGDKTRATALPEET